MKLPEDMHPLVRRVAGEVTRGLVDEGRLRTLRDEVLELDGESLRDCVRELIYMATVLEETGHGDIASGIFEMVESRPVITGLDRANSTRLAVGGESVVLAAKKFAKFSARERTVRDQDTKKGRPLSEMGPARFAGLRLR